MGKEFARHFVYRLTEKEVEACRAQIRDMVRKKRLFEVSNALGNANNVPDSSVSRSSSGSSTSSWQRQGHGFAHDQRNLTSTSLSNVGSLRRKKGHKHSSSMTSVMRTTGGLQHRYYHTPGSRSHRSNSITWADQFEVSCSPRSDNLVRRAGRDPAVVLV